MRDISRLGAGGIYCRDILKLVSVLERRDRFCLCPLADGAGVGLNAILFLSGLGGYNSIVPSMRGEVQLSVTSGAGVPVEAIVM